MPDTKYLNSNVKESLLMDITSTLRMDCTKILKSKGNGAREDHCALECDAMLFGAAQHHVLADSERHIRSCDKLKHTWLLTYDWPHLKPHTQKNK
jgi:hypothetical protein